MNPVTQILVPYVVLVIALVFHEAAHALVAKWGGDLTAYHGGQVTLNPIPHMRREPLGTIILPLVALISSGGTMCFGFAHAPVSPLWMHRHPKRASLMAAAGPAANILLVVVASLLLLLMVKVGAAEASAEKGIKPMSDYGWQYAAWLILRWMVLLNILLAIFNLVPLPPLDGATVLEGFIPALRGPYQLIRSQPILALIGVLAIANFVVIPWLFWPTWNQVMRLLYSLAS